MNTFQQKFLKLIEAPEDEEAIAASPTAQDDSAAFRAGLDQNTDPEAFDDVPENPINDLKRQQYGQTIDRITQWIDQTESWVETLNGVGETSMNAQLSRADCDSVMADIRRSESKKISRLAQDLSALSESLKQYLLSAQQKRDSNENI